MMAMLVIRVIVFDHLFGRLSACRWAIYAGTEPESAASLFTTPTHSLCYQTNHTPFREDAQRSLFFDEGKYRLRNHGINQDGWGLGWYSTRSGNAKRYRDPEGATDENKMIDPDLVGITQSIHSNVIFAHIRASTAGHQRWCNSHPFQFNQLLWMHNGGVPADVQIVLERMLIPQVKHLVAGTTDSEHLAGHFVSNLSDRSSTDECYVCSQNSFPLNKLQQALKNTIGTVEHLERDIHASSLNFAISDGHHVLATRYRTNRLEDPPTLYYARTRKALWLASEPLDGMLAGIYKGESRKWTALAKDEMISYTVDDDTLQLECLSPACVQDRQHRLEVDASGMLRSEEDSAFVEL